MAAGASEVRVDAATVTVDPAGGGPGRDVGQVAGAQSGVSELRLTIPGRPGADPPRPPRRPDGC